jgi:hypothetical protein
MRPERRSPPKTLGVRLAFFPLPLPPSADTPGADPKAFRPFAQRHLVASRCPTCVHKRESAVRKSIPALLHPLQPLQIFIWSVTADSRQLKLSGWCCRTTKAAPVGQAAEDRRAVAKDLIQLKAACRAPRVPRCLREEGILLGAEERVIHVDINGLQSPPKAVHRISL